jgi:hypothetical protein
MDEVLGPALSKGPRAGWEETNDGRDQPRRDLVVAGLL